MDLLKCKLPLIQEYIETNGWNWMKASTKAWLMENNITFQFTVVYDYQLVIKFFIVLINLEHSYQVKT